MSQKLRRVLLLVGVVDSGVLIPVTGTLPTAGVRVMGEGLDFKTREPLRCLGLSFTSFTGRGVARPDETTITPQKHCVFLPTEEPTA